MKLRAKVKHPTEDCRTIFHQVIDGKIVSDTFYSMPSWAQIEEAGERPSHGFLLLFLDEKKEYQADSWFQTLQDVKEVAKEIMGIEEDDWEPVEE